MEETIWRLAIHCNGRTSEMNANWRTMIKTSLRHWENITRKSGKEGNKKKKKWRQNLKKEGRELGENRLSKKGVENWGKTWRRKNLLQKVHPQAFQKKWEKIKEEKPVAEGSPEGFQKKNWKKRIPYNGRKLKKKKNLLLKVHIHEAHSPPIQQLSSFSCLPCILYFVFCILYFVFCILYFVFCILYQGYGCILLFMFPVFWILFFIMYQCYILHKHCSIVTCQTINQV